MYILPENTDFVIFPGISTLLILEFWPYIKYSNEQFVTATSFETPAWNSVKLCMHLGHNVHITRKSRNLFFPGISALLKLELWTYIKYVNKQFVSANPLQLLHGILVKLWRHLGHNVHITRKFRFRFFF